MDLRGWWIGSKPLFYFEVLAFFVLRLLGVSDLSESLNDSRVESRFSIVDSLFYLFESLSFMDSRFALLSKSFKDSLFYLSISFIDSWVLGNSISLKDSLFYFSYSFRDSRLFFSYSFRDSRLFFSVSFKVSRFLSLVSFVDSFKLFTKVSTSVRLWLLLFYLAINLDIL